MGLDCRCSGIAADRVSDRRRLEQQQHDCEQQLFDYDDQQQHGAANDAAAEHHGFRGDVNTATIAAGIDSVDAADTAGSPQVAIITRTQKNVPAPLAPGPSYLSSDEPVLRNARVGRERNRSRTQGSRWRPPLSPEIQFLTVHC